MSVVAKCFKYRCKNAVLDLSGCSIVVVVDGVIWGLAGSVMEDGNLIVRFFF